MGYFVDIHSIFPKIVNVKDYHEFNEYTKVLYKMLDMHFIHQEIGFDGTYYAVIYPKGMRMSKKKIDNLKKEYGLTDLEPVDF